MSWFELWFSLISYMNFSDMNCDLYRSACFTQKWILSDKMCLNCTGCQGSFKCLCSLKMFLGTFLYRYIIKISQVWMKSKTTLCYLYTWTQLEHIMHISLSKRLCADMHAHTHTLMNRESWTTRNYVCVCVCVCVCDIFCNVYWTCL